MSRSFIDSANCWHFNIAGDHHAVVKQSMSSASASIFGCSSQHAATLKRSRKVESADRRFDISVKNSTRRALDILMSPWDATMLHQRPLDADAGIGASASPFFVQKSFHSLGNLRTR